MSSRRFGLKRICISYINSKILWKSRQQYETHLIPSYGVKEWGDALVKEVEKVRQVYDKRTAKMFNIVLLKNGQNL